MCRKTQLQANLSMFYQVTHEDLKVSISCHLPQCNLVGCIWWLQEGKDLGNKVSLPGEDGGGPGIVCEFLNCACRQLTQSFPLSWNVCSWNFLLALSSVKIVSFFSPAHNPMLQILKTLHFVAHPFWKPLLLHIPSYLLNLIHFLKFCTGLPWQPSG